MKTSRLLFLTALSALSVFSQGCYKDDSGYYQKLIVHGNVSVDDLSEVQGPAEVCNQFEAEDPVCEPVTIDENGDFELVSYEGESYINDPDPKTSYQSSFYLKTKNRVYAVRIDDYKFYYPLLKLIQENKTQLHQVCKSAYLPDEKQGFAGRPQEKWPEYCFSIVVEVWATFTDDLGE